MTRRVVAVAVAVLALLTGCGVPVDEEPVVLQPTPSPAPTSTPDGPAVEVAVYLFDAEGFLEPVLVGVDPSGNRVAEVIRALATTTGEAQGLGTSVDATTTLNSGSPVDDAGVLDIDITPPTTGENEAQVEAYAQLVYTLTGLDGVRGVRFTINGEIPTIPTQLEDEPAERVLTRRDYPCFDPTTTSAICDTV